MYRERHQSDRRICRSVEIRRRLRSLSFFRLFAFCLLPLIYLQPPSNDRDFSSLSLVLCCGRLLCSFIYFIINPSWCIHSHIDSFIVVWFNGVFMAFLDLDKYFLYLVQDHVFMSLENSKESAYRSEYS